ncbi:MAG TPA: DUF72 domain-containing protein [Chryseosolibacter sp.]|nr:DUF72 domain-containing protein [Chryseosolibacter sp.]
MLGALQVWSMKKWWIGCSGFYYKHWREKFYPKGLPQRKWFEFYCEYFNTVELNVTFYRFPKIEALQGWYERSPDDFRFTVKAPRLITHYKKFHNAWREVGDFYALAGNGLREKLGCVLFQLPPNLVYSEAHLENILATVDPAFTNVIEFRHESWWKPKVYKTLKDNNITFCGISYPSLPDEVISSRPVLYYRFHGVPQLYASSYSREKMKQVCDDINAFRGISDVYIYFNNDIDVGAVYNARELRQLVTK